MFNKSWWHQANHNGLWTATRLAKKQALYLCRWYLCVWRCLAIYKRLACGEKNLVQERNRKATLNLAREYYGDNKLKKKGCEDYKTFWRHCKAPQCEYHVLWTKEEFNIYMAVRRQDSAQKRLVYNKHGAIGMPLFLHPEDWCALWVMGL